MAALSINCAGLGLFVAEGVGGDAKEIQGFCASLK